MVHVTPRQLLEITGARHACGPLDRPATGVAIDSRAVQAENLFVALPGERVDGNDYACGALDAGAAAVVMCQGWRGASRVAAHQSICSRQASEACR